MNVSIRWPLILGSIALVWGTHLIIAPYSYLMSEQVLNHHAQDIMQNISDLTLEQSHNHLAKAESAANLAKQLLSSNVVRSDTAGTAALERYFFDQLTVFPHLAGIYFGTPDGEFFYVSRNEERSAGGFRTKIIRFRDDERTTQLVWRNPEFEVVARAEAPEDTYDPRTRPWFRKVMEEQHIVWTAPYVFFTSRKPGVTIAGPARDDVGTLKGIVGVDIDIAELSTFIGRLRVGKSGRAFMLNRNRDVIAYHDVEQLTVGGDGNILRLPKIEELDDPIVREAFAAVEWDLDQDGEFRLPEEVSARFTLEGKSYLCMFTPFPGSELPWVIGVYVPEDDYLGSLKHNRLVNAVSTIVVSVLASMLALLFARHVSEPITNLQREARAIEENDLKAEFDTGSMFSEIQETANSFTRMKRSLIGFKDELREKEAMYRTITNTANDAIVTMDDSHRISYWNPAAERMFGWGQDEIVGRDLHQVLAPERFRDEAREALARFDREGTGPMLSRTVEVHACSKAGQELPVELSLARLSINGKWHAAAIIRDVTERKKAEQLRKRLVRDLHDGIGGNLANIKLLSEMARRDELPEGPKRSLASITEVSDNCIAELRNYMNVLDENSPGWQDTLDELREYCGRTLDPHGLGFHMETNLSEEAAPPSTLLYMNLFKIVREAVTNVIKHAQATQVVLQVAITQELLTCRVVDNGRGDGPHVGSGRGLLSMESRARELGGELDISYADGLQVTLTVPLAGS